MADQIQSGFSLSSVASKASGCLGWGKWIVGAFFGVLVLAGAYMWLRESITSSKKSTYHPLLEQQQNKTRIENIEAQRQRELQKASRYRQEQINAHNDSHYIENPENTAWYHKPRSAYCFPKPDYIQKVFNNHDECYLNIQRFREYIDKGYATCTKDRFRNFIDRDYPCCTNNVSGGGGNRLSGGAQ